jgi:hypothetical protein
MTDHHIDFMSSKSAELLAARIERFWRKHGYQVQTHIVHQGELSGSPVYGIRSNLQNGKPHDQAPPQQEAEHVVAA